MFVESESRRIGAITLPDALLERFHRGACVEIHAALDERVAFLLEDYGHLFDDRAGFKAQLARLIGLHSRELVTRWQQMIDDDVRGELFRELLERHYDPAYQRSSRQHFSELAHAQQFTFRPTAGDTSGQARALLAQLSVSVDADEAKMAHAPT